jgi:uncharacterized repeat protein (TIGR01451 family)
MKQDRSQCGQILRSAGAFLGFALIASLGAPTSAWADTAPQLSIAVDNGHASTKSGDQLDFTITVKNLGTSPVKSLSVTQTVPTGLTFKSADAAGVAHVGIVTWNVDLKSGGTATVHTSMTVSATPDDLLRLATVACAGSSGHVAPIVCATDSDQLPAGATAEASVARAAASSARGSVWQYYLAGGVAAFAAIAGALIIRRRRTHRTA